MEKIENNDLAEIAEKEKKSIYTLKLKIKYKTESLEKMMKKMNRNIVSIEVPKTMNQSCVSIQTE